MSMHREEALRRYISLNDRAKAHLLGRLCFDMTIAFRSVVTEATPTEIKLKSLMGLNEIQHQLSSQLLAHLSKTTSRYPDEAFFSILLEKGKQYGLGGVVQQNLIRELARSDRLQ